MFEQTRLLRALAKLQVAAGTSREQDEQLLYVARNTRVLKDSVEFSKGGVGPELGAARLVLALCELTAGTDGPRPLMDALDRLFTAAVVSIQSFLQRHSSRYTPALILNNAAMRIRSKMQETSLDSDSSARSKSANPQLSSKDTGRTTKPHRDMPLNPSMPDISTSEIARRWESPTHTAVLVKDAKAYADRLGHSTSPIAYPLTMAAVEKSSHGSVLFVTREKSIFGTECLCLFDKNGTHINLGSSEQWREEDAFCAKALEVIAEHLRLTQKFRETIRGKD